MLKEKDEEIAKLQQEKKNMERDLKKILKQQIKLNQTNAESEQYKKLLEVIVSEVSNVPPYVVSIEQLSLKLRWIFVLTSVLIQLLKILSRIFELITPQLNDSCRRLFQRNKW